MLKHLLKIEYPELDKKDYQKAVKFIEGKCSQYYFLDYMRTTNGNVDDSIEFYVFDDQLRSLLQQYLIRFEIQLKTDFVDCVQSSTRSMSFWKHRKFFIPESRRASGNKKRSKYRLLYNKIKRNISRLYFETMGPSNYVVMYSSSFGTFLELFKLIDGNFKDSFIAKYTDYLAVHDFHALIAYFEAIRRVRNRCAHGNHVITLKMVNDLNKLRSSVNKAPLKKDNYRKTVLESTLAFVIANLNCGEEFQSKLITLLNEHAGILLKHQGRPSLSPNSASKLS